MIKIGNINNGDQGVYCGRGTPLGNPYSLELFTRDQCCDFYDGWLDRAVKNKDTEVMKELHFIKYTELQDGEVTLLCHCVPLRCHCESIKKQVLNLSEKT